AGALPLPGPSSNGRCFEVGAQFDARRFGQALVGDSAAVTRLLAHLASVDVSYGRSQTSTYNRTGFLPSFGYQLALGGFDSFRRPAGLLAGPAADHGHQ